MGLDIKEGFPEVATRAGAKHLLDLKGVGPGTCRQSRQYVCEQELVWAFCEVGKNRRSWLCGEKRRQMG